MENVNKQQGLAKISEVAGAIKEIEHENSSEDISSDQENQNKSKKNESKVYSKKMPHRVNLIVKYLKNQIMSIMGRS